MKRDANTPTHGQRFRETIARGAKRERRYARNTRIVAGWLLFSVLICYAVLILVAWYLFTASGNRDHADVFIRAFAWIMIAVAVAALVPTYMFASINIKYIINPFRKVNDERPSDTRSCDLDSPE